MKLRYDVPRDPTEQIHLVKDQRYYPNYHQSDFHKTINLGEDFPEEDSPEEEDSQVEEEDSPEVEDTPEGDMDLQVLDHPVEDGDHCQF